MYCAHFSLKFRQSVCRALSSPPTRSTNAPRSTTSICCACPCQSVGARVTLMSCVPWLTLGSCTRAMSCARSHVSQSVSQSQRIARAPRSTTSAGGPAPHRRVKTALSRKAGRLKNGRGPVPQRPPVRTEKPRSSGGHPTSHEVMGPAPVESRVSLSPKGGRVTRMVDYRGG